MVVANVSWLRVSQSAFNSRLCHSKSSSVNYRRERARARMFRKRTKAKQCTFSAWVLCSWRLRLRSRSESESGLRFRLVQIQIWIWSRHSMFGSYFCARKFEAKALCREIALKVQTFCLPSSKQQLKLQLARLDYILIAIWEPARNGERKNAIQASSGSA